MKVAQYIFSYRFYPVGQGLFSSGFLQRGRREEVGFTWVYDCGTSSSQRLIDSGISQLLEKSSFKRKIDLVTLSHFDADHISGVCRLIKEFQIETLMLPYMPLAQRLLLAFEEQLDPVDELMGFFVNPVEYLLSRDGPGIGRILFVAASGGEGPPIPEDLPRLPDEGDHEFEIDFDREEMSGDDETQLLRENSRRVLVEWLRRGGSIRVRGFWEFVPYNDATRFPITPLFQREVEQERKFLISNSEPVTRKDALIRLKKLYDKHFGSSAIARNIISLFLYAGPIYSTCRDFILSDYQQVFKYFPELHGDCIRACLNGPNPWGLFGAIRLPRMEDTCSLLYTGDGYLNTRSKLQRLVRYLRKQRVDRIGVFQVMHHGAQANWHKGVASTINPNISIFSSDPDRKPLGHPHAEVLRDFWAYGPNQVDKERGVTARGWVELK